MSEDVVISVTNLKKTYIVGETKVRALRGVDFEIKKGVRLSGLTPFAFCYGIRLPAGVWSAASIRRTPRGNKRQ